MMAIFFIFFYFPFVLKFNLGSVSFVRLQADSRVTNISDVKGKKKKKEVQSGGSLTTYCNNYSGGLVGCGSDF